MTPHPEVRVDSKFNITPNHHLHNNNINNDKYGIDLLCSTTYLTSAQNIASPPQPIPTHPKLPRSLHRNVKAICSFCTSYRGAHAKRKGRPTH